jgi:hypothetical protein
VIEAKGSAGASLITSKIDEDGAFGAAFVNFKHH